MAILRLFMEDFNPATGFIAYTVEDSGGDRIARGEYTSESLKAYSPITMDFFLLGFLPQLTKLDMRLEVQGPVSRSLLDVIDNNKIETDSIINANNRQYDKTAIEFFKTVFQETQDLNETLKSVFNYYK